MEVYDLQGLLVKQSSTNRINFQDENEGIYIVRIEFINGNF
ncbi:MAG: T9SS type A sorting domain-containing protein [Saprospiraceae bacterium]|nr:T9SS type A sorting domain-containing protein [Saprospiraceae bacterium]